jgi:hypothetical protein
MLKNQVPNATHGPEGDVISAPNCFLFKIIPYGFIRSTLQELSEI